MKVQVRGRINAPADAVFKEVSDFGFLDRLDLIESCTVEGNGVGAVRTAKFTDHKLGRVVERLEAYDATARNVRARSSPDVRGLLPGGCRRDSSVRGGPFA